ncbi:MAG: hypothetical protein AB7H97_13475, partial [Pseudobdellovibrionaceae bacterium]
MQLPRWKVQCITYKKADTKESTAKKPRKEWDTRKKRLEDGGVIVSQTKGRTRLFLWNPRYPFCKELQTLLEKSFEFMPESEIKKYYRKRQRPRRTG